MAQIAIATLKVLDLSKKLARITGTVTDDVSGDVVAVSIETVINMQELASERIRIINNLFAEYEAAAAKATAIASMVSSWEAALTSDLQAKVDE